MKLISGALLGAGAQALNMVGALASRVLLWRLLGPAAYGGIAVSINLVTVISRSMSLGIVPATQHFSAKTEQNAEQQRGIVGTAIWMGTAIGLILTVLAYALHGSLSKVLLNSDSNTALLWLTAGIALVLIASVLSAVLISLRQYVQYNLVALITGVGMPLLLVVASLRASPITATVGAHLISWAFALAVSFYFVRRAVRGAHWDKRWVAPLGRYALETWPNVILAVGASRLVTLVGAAYLGEMSLSYFVLAVNVTEALFALFTPVSQLLFSHVSARDKESFGLAAQALRLSTLLFCGVALVFALVGKPVMLFVLGADSAPAWPACLLLLLTAIAHALLRIISGINAGIGRQRLNLVVLAVEVGLLAVTIPLFASRWGLMGLGVSSALAATVAFMVGIIQIRRMMAVGTRHLMVPTLDDINFLIVRTRASLAALRKNRVAGSQ